MLAHVSAAGGDGRSNPEGPVGPAGPLSALHGLSGIRPEMVAAAGNRPRARKKRLTSPERWEVTQLIKSGVLSVEEYPDFDDEHGQVRRYGFRIRVLVGFSRICSCIKP